MTLTSACPLVFISYSHKDEVWKDRLVRHLRMFEQEGTLEVWDDHRIVAGADWSPEIEAAMARARVAVVLISADSLTSGFIRDREIPELLGRRATAGLLVIPVIVRPCAWRVVSWLETIQCWKRGVELASLPEADAERHLFALALEIRDLLKPHPTAVAHGTTVAANLAKPVEPPFLPPPRAPALPQPPLPQPLPAPRRSHSKFLVGIGCGAVLAILALASLGERLSKQNAETLSAAGPPAATSPAAGTASAAVTLGGRFANVWFEPNVQQDGRSGMLIHAVFTVEGARQQSCQAAVIFYDSTGQILRDLAVAQNFTPPDEQADYEDFTLFLPYDELHMEPGDYELRFQMKLYHQPTESVIAESAPVEFMIVVL